MPVPANNGFPVDLHVGQGAYPNELDLGQPAKNRQGKRFRGRDEWLLSMLLDGAAAPEPISVGGVTVDGVSLTTPASHFISGLSVANGSYSVSIDLFDWRAPDPTNWKDVLVKSFDVPIATVCFANVELAVSQNVGWALWLVLRMTVDGTEVARQQVGSEWIKAKKFLWHHGALNWAGAVGIGLHEIKFQLTFGSSTQPGRNLLLAENAPIMAIAVL